MNVIQCFAYCHGDLHSPLGRKLSPIAQNLAQQLPWHDLHRDIHPAAFRLRKRLHYRGMIQGFANLLLALKALVEQEVAFYFGVRHFEGDVIAGEQVRRPQDRGCITARDNILDRVPIELTPRLG